MEWKSFLLIRWIDDNKGEEHILHQSTEIAICGYERDLCLKERRKIEY